MISNKSNPKHGKFKPKIKHYLSYTIVLICCISTVQSISDQRSNEQASSLAKPQSCLKSWFLYGGKCLRFMSSPRNYAAATSKCIDLNAKIVVIEDESIKEKETYGEPSASIISQLPTDSYTNETKPIQTSRQYYVNISSELLNQFLERQQGGYYHDGHTIEAYEHLDTELSAPSLWLPRDDPSIANIIMNFTSLIEKDIQPAFALAYSTHLSRWGLVPVSPTRRMLFICERRIDPKDSQTHPVIISNTPEPTPISTTPPFKVVTSTIAPNNPRTVMDTASTIYPTQDATSMVFREYPQDQSVVLGSTAEMRCSPLDGKMSQLSWIFNGKNLTQTPRIKIQSSGVLRIEHVRNTDDGNYTCSIRTGTTTESKSARLEIIERPHQPEYISVELLDRLSTSVRIKWTPGFDGNRPIINYQVEMKTVESDNIENELNSIMQSNTWEVAKANISSDQTSVIIPDLKPAKKYIFRVRATNRVGTGDASLPNRHSIEVPVQPPSSPPENLTGTPKSSTSIAIQWTPPPSDSQNGVIKAYRIRHKLAGYASSSEWYYNEAQESAHLNYVIDDLIVWQNYEIQVAAENDKGVGPFSSSIFVKTKEGKPDKGPQNVQADPLTHTMIKVTWNPPPPQHINGFNQGYKVEVWSDERQTQPVKDIKIPHSTISALHSTTIDGLLPYTKYYITVKCLTNAGEGLPNEDAVSVRTKQYFPEAIAALEFTDVLDKSLRIIWKPPNRTNGELTHYTLEYSQAQTTNRKTTRRLSADTWEAKIFDLQPQTSYIFEMYPNTVIGPGPVKSAQITTSVPPTLPEPPSDLTYSSVGPYNVTIHFNPGFDGHAKLEKWIVEALTPSSSAHTPLWQRIYVSTNHSADNTLVVRNLRPFTRYKIRLIPVNIVGESLYPSSPTSEFTTAQVAPDQPPSDLSIEEVKQRSVVAHWSPLNDSMWLGSPLGYNLTWSEIGNASISHILINDTSADSFLVNHLEEFMEYSFTIYAVNHEGSSPPSESISVTTLEDVPTASPSNVSAHAKSSNAIEVRWDSVPARHKNGIIKGYKIQYQAVKPDAPVQLKVVEDSSAKHVTLNDLKAFSTYHLAVSAMNTAGEGVYSRVITVQTLEHTPEAPQNISFPTVSQTTARILWDPPENPNGDIIGYKVAYHTLTDSNKESAHELHENERTFKATNLKPDTHYIFTVTAKTKEGWGQQASMLIYTHDSELRANLPFFKESWFVILCACSSVVITILITALLFIQTKSYKYRRAAIKSTSQDRLGDAGFTIDDEPGNHYNNGFGLLSQGPSNHRRSNGALSQSTANFTLPKTPPRPQPGSIVYSDEGDDDVFEDVVEKQVKSRPGTSNYDSSGDSLTEKPSEISSSPAPESDSADEEYANMADRQFVNHYANVNGTLRSQKSWKKVSKNYASSSSYRTKPKLPQRPVPSIPKVPGNGDPSSSSSENNSQNMRPGTSGMQSMPNGFGPIYGENSGSMTNQQQASSTQTPQPSYRSATSNSQTPINHNSDSANLDCIDSRPSAQANDMLNGHIVNLNGGRIIVDNMAGSRAPLPGFTSFV